MDRCANILQVKINIRLISSFPRTKGLKWKIHLDVTLICRMTGLTSAAESQFDMFSLV